MTQSAASSAEHQLKSLATRRTPLRGSRILHPSPLISTCKFWKTPIVTVCLTNCPKTIPVKENWWKIWMTMVTAHSTRQKLELESTTVLATWAPTHLTQTPITMASVTVQIQCHLCALLVLTPTLSEPVRSAQLFSSTTPKRHRSIHPTQFLARHGKFPLICLLDSSLMLQPASSVAHRPKPWTTPRSPSGRTPLTR